MRILDKLRWIFGKPRDPNERVFLVWSETRMWNISGELQGTIVPINGRVDDRVKLFVERLAAAGFSVTERAPIA